MTYHLDWINKISLVLISLLSCFNWCIISFFHLIFYGVPQGLILGPLLLLLLSVDVLYVHDMYFHCYADITQLYLFESLFNLAHCTHKKIGCPETEAELC